MLRIISRWLVQARAMATACRSVTGDNVNPNLKQIDYAVRGPLVIRAGEIEKEMKKGKKKPFKQVIKANIGDAHAMGQQPITFLRQVLALVSLPSLISSCDFPEDAKQRARTILDGCGGKSVGAYSDSLGIELIRKNVAGYIERRDCHPSDWNNIMLTSGASSGIKNVLQLFCNKIDGKKSAVMVPIPQYPLYSATLSEYNLGLVGYYLDEENKWGLDVDELKRAYCDASKKFAVRAIVVINPGNPTGQLLPREGVEAVLRFAHASGLFVLADEVYQANVYQGTHVSFKKVMMEMGAPYNQLELASFMSVSKGYTGECGLRGGWMELVNLDPEVRTHMLKGISAMLCPTVLGQTAVDCVAKPPMEGEPSHALWCKEMKHVLSTLAARADMVVKAFNSMEGFHCQPLQGAMYAFPRLKLPPKAVAAAKEAGQPPDVFYAFRLLEETGICVVPGSGFSQRPGTHHFRTTILPPTDLLKVMLSTFGKFQTKFMNEFS